MGELERKLRTIRACLELSHLGGVRLRGTDWFSWATCGGSSAVLLTTDVGIAEVWVTLDGAWVLTDEIEARRLAEEELPRGYEVWACGWNDLSMRETLISRLRGSGPIASDRPVGDEVPLPAQLVEARSRLCPEELDRYRTLGRDAALAMTEVLRAARPEWTGFLLAGAAAEALWIRGIHPALTLVGDERRLPLHRHATASREPLGGRAMLVFCGRRHGLFANLTRFVYFREPTKEERALAMHVARVEAVALDHSKPGTPIADVLAAMVKTYRELGHPGAERLHHQGGPCGYLSRDAIARTESKVKLEGGNAVAWNPSLPGAKIEDTAVVTRLGVEILTVDPSWPSFTLEDRQRPDLLVK
jgi:Xaa-Pro aminopeptidase